MKKFIVLILLIILPISVKAISITEAYIDSDGGNEDTIPITFKLKFSDFQDEGIFMVIFQISSTNDAIEPKSKISSNGNFDTIVEKDSDKIMIASSAKENTPNQCPNSKLYCGDYETTLDFSIVKPEKEIVIKFDIIEIVTFPTNIEFNEEDETQLKEHLKKKYFISDSSLTIYLSEETEEPETNSSSNIAPEETINVKDDFKDLIDTTIKDNIIPSPEKPSTPKSSTPKKSKNTNIKSLTIKDHEIKFANEKHNYAIEVDKEINKLEINLELEDNKSTYSIKGAEDLKENDNKVLIEIKAEDGTTETYTIEAFTKKEAPEAPIEIFGYKIPKKTFKIGIITIILIVLFIIIKVITKIIRENYSNRKIKKALKKLK